MTDPDPQPPACDEITLGFYSREAASYAAMTHQGSVQWLDGFMRMLPAGGRVLELGCGSGRDAELMLSRGFIVDATDGAPMMAAQAEARLGRPVKVMRFDEIEDAGVYDGVWAHASLLHVPRPALGLVLERVFRALKPGGLHFANYKSGDMAGRDHLDRFYNYPDEDMLAGIYASSAPWDALALEPYIGGSYGGGRTPWIAVTARKPAS